MLGQVNSGYIRLIQFMSCLFRLRHVMSG